VTIAISVKVNDGLVLAADSASTIMNTNTPGPGAAPGVVNIYNNASKIINLCKGRPIGAVVWGAGSIGVASISTLLKDLRKRLSGQDPATVADWALTDAYTIEQVTQRTKQFLFDECYVAAYGPGQAPGKPSLGVVVAGYSSGQGLPESRLIRINEGDCPDPTVVQAQDDNGCWWDGQPEAIHRVLVGYGIQLPSILQQLGVGPLLLGGVMNHIKDALAVPMILSPMPIQDAIDLAHFLVHLTIMYSRFSPGAPTVGGPIEIAAITKHEGYKWIKRKHYYESRLNP
jgi:hypothetical protein